MPGHQRRLCRYQPRSFLLWHIVGRGREVVDGLHSRHLLVFFGSEGGPGGGGRVNPVVHLWINGEWGRKYRIKDSGYLPFLKAGPCLFDFALSHMGGFCSWFEIVEYDTGRPLSK